MTEAKLCRPRGRPSRHGKDFPTRVPCSSAAVPKCSPNSRNATALDRGAPSASAPKAFYHHFASKEAFVAAVVDNYAAYFAKKSTAISATGAAPCSNACLKSTFIADACAGMQRHDFRRGCLVVGNLQAGGQRPRRAGLQQRLEAVFLDWERRLAACLADAFAASRATFASHLACRRLAEAPPDTATTDNVYAAPRTPSGSAGGAVLRGRLGNAARRR